MDIQSCWRAFARGDLLARDAILTENLSLVHHVARQLERYLPDDIDHDELVSAGTFGLMSAMSAFDSTRGIAFSTFAYPRIRGAILDDLRRGDHVPRSVRRKMRDIHNARAALAATLCRNPEDAEVAAALGVDIDTFWRWQSDVEGAIRVPIDRPSSDSDEGNTATFDAFADPACGADEQIGREEELVLLRHAITQLKERERTVVSLYYYEDLTLSQIADVLDLTESRVSQIRTKALARLRETVSLAFAA